MVVDVVKALKLLEQPFTTVVLPEAVIPVAFGAGILGTSMAVGG
jgi:hypothetical protein